MSDSIIEYIQYYTGNMSNGIDNEINEILAYEAISYLNSNVIVVELEKLTKNDIFYL